jgi:signal peptidase II
LPLSRNAAKILYCLVPAAVVLVLDLATKAWASAGLAVGDELRVTGFFNLVLGHNSGAAFSFLSGDGPGQGLKMALLTSLALVPLAWFYRQTGPGDRASLAALGAVFGGALGNVHDRLRFGAVVDFLDFHLGDRHWPAFNIADAGIVAGILVFVLAALAEARREARARKSASSGGGAGGSGGGGGGKSRRGRKGVNPKSPTRI